jgi:hypothetical protein
MNHTRLESAVAVLLLAGSLGAASACAGSIPGAVDAIAPPWVDGANVDGAAVEPFADASPSAVGRQRESDVEQYYFGIRLGPCDPLATGSIRSGSCARARRQAGAPQEPIP